MNLTELEDWLDDCPMCLSAGSVWQNRCQICDAQFDVARFSPGSGTPNGDADLPPAAPSVGVRATDLLQELEDIAGSIGVPQSQVTLATACLRAATIMMQLRVFILQDLVGRDITGGASNGWAISGGPDQPNRPVT